MSVVLLGGAALLTDVAWSRRGSGVRSIDRQAAVKPWTSQAWARLERVLEADP